MSPSFYRPTGKRLLDLVVTVASLPLTIPIALLVALAVRLDLGSPVLFRQGRIGRDGRPFTLVKFRTMREPAGGPEDGADDAGRISRLGDLLRRTSLDELPELVHVLSGRMSLVGPRPLLPRYLPRYSARQARRHEVDPGLTGLAQIRGRNALTWEEKLEYDVEYVDRLSFRLDLSILAQTAWAVVTGRGTNAPGHPSMPEFRGRQGQEEQDGQRHNAEPSP